MQLRRLDNDQVRWLQPDPAAPWSSVSFSALPLTNFPTGQAMLTVFTNGIPSLSRLIQVNSALSITASSSQTATKGIERALTLGSFADPGTTGPWSVSVAWGDGSVVTRFNVTTTGTLTALHIYTETGAYSVTVTLGNSNGGVTTGNFSVTIVEPTALNEAEEPQAPHLLFLPLIKAIPEK